MNALNVAIYATIAAASRGSPKPPNKTKSGGPFFGPAALTGRSKGSTYWGIPRSSAC
jgi:hypothetical protein